MNMFKKYGKFVITSNGTVWIERKNYARMSKINVGSHGYKQVWFNGEVKLIHRLVAENFIKNPLNLTQVDHKNRNKLDNRICNLEWVTPKENSSRANNKKVKWNGMVFDSLADLSKETGLAKNTISHNIKIGRLIKGHKAVKVGYGI